LFYLLIIISGLVIPLLIVLHPLNVWLTCQNPCMLPLILSDKFYVFLKARNNARVLLSGSLDLFSNRYAIIYTLN
jgi:hypothetical protein